MALESLPAVVSDLSSIAETASSETKLVSQDNLARGELIEVKVATANRREEQDKKPVWTVSISALETQLTDADYAEFWGQRSNYTSDFIAGTAQYPWMPSNVSKPSWF